MRDLRYRLHELLDEAIDIVEAMVEPTERPVTDIEAQAARQIAKAETKTGERLALRGLARQTLKRLKV